MEELVTANKKFVNAFKGKSVAEAKKLLGEASYQESAWSDHGVPGMQGKEIIASYPNCEVMLYSLDDEVIMAGIHIMAD